VRRRRRRRKEGGTAIPVSDRLFTRLQIGLPTGERLLASAQVVLTQLHTHTHTAHRSHRVRPVNQSPDEPVKSAAGCEDARTPPRRGDAAPTGPPRLRLYAGSAALGPAATDEGAALLSNAAQCTQTVGGRGRSVSCCAVVRSGGLKVGRVVRLSSAAPVTEGSENGSPRPPPDETAVNGLRSIERLELRSECASRAVDSFTHTHQRQHQHRHRISIAITITDVSGRDRQRAQSVSHGHSINQSVIPQQSSRSATSSGTECREQSAEDQCAISRRSERLPHMASIQTCKMTRRGMRLTNRREGR
jgi:hypothetical protein